MLQPMNSLRSVAAAPAYENDEDCAALTKMKADAAKDFSEWKQTRKLIKRLSRQDSMASAASRHI
jgi:hypothetical protein